MKTARVLTAILLLSASFAARAGADPYTPQSDPNINPHALEDPDGVPLAVTQAKSQSRQDSDAQKKQGQAPKDNDWLMRAYQEQLKVRLDAQANHNSPSVYNQITSDKDLSKMAGLQYVDPAQNQGSSLRTGATTSGKATLTLRPDPPANLRPSHSTITAAFKPLITPLGATDVAGLHNFYSSLPSASSPLLPRNAPVAVTPKAAAVDDGPSSLDMPGLTAAQSDPLKRSSLTFDLSGDGSLPESDSSKSNVALPLATNIENLRQQEAAKLQVAGAPPKLIKPIPINPVAIKVPDDLVPVPVAPANPGRAGIADPHDIFYR